MFSALAEGSWSWSRARHPVQAGTTWRPISLWLLLRRAPEGNTRHEPGWRHPTTGASMCRALAVLARRPGPASARPRSDMMFEAITRPLAETRHVETARARGRSRRRSALQHGPRAGAADLQRRGRAHSSDALPDVSPPGGTRALLAPHLSRRL